MKKFIFTILCGLLAITTLKAFEVNKNNNVEIKIEKKTSILKLDESEIKTKLNFFKTVNEKISEEVINVAISRKGVILENRIKPKINCLEGVSTSQGLTYWHACVEFPDGDIYFVELVYNTSTGIQTSSHAWQDNRCSCQFD